jgi:hypothetical protein
VHEARWGAVGGVGWETGGHGKHLLEGGAAGARVGVGGQVLGEQPADGLVQAAERMLAQRDPDQRGGDALGDREDVEVGGRRGAVVVALDHQHAVTDDQHAAQGGVGQARAVVDARQDGGVHARVLRCGGPPAVGRPGGDRLPVRSDAGDPVRSDAGDPVRSVQATASTQTTATSVARAQPTRRLAGSTAACTAVISPSPRPHVLSAPRGSASTPPPPPTDRSRR